MQFLLYQAGQLGCRPTKPSIFGSDFRPGWRTREPAETEFAPEQPKLFPRILKLHYGELGYDMAEFSKLLCIFPNDLRHLYGIQEKAAVSSHLRLLT